MGYRTLACLALAMTAGAGPAAAQRGIVSEQGAPAESPDAAALSVERAWRNYNAIVGGTRQLWQLSPIELQEVMSPTGARRARSASTPSSTGSAPRRPSWRCARSTSNAASAERPLQAERSSSS